MFKIKKFFSSDILSDSTHTQKIAYIAVMTALCVVCNMFFEFKLADTQFSLTIFFSAITGMIIGPLFGFAACFLGDLVGFLYNSGGFMYMPWIGLSMGLVAFIAGLIMNCVDLNNKFAIYIKISVVCVLTFLICTVAINTTAFWLIYNTRKVPFTAYLVARLFVQGQIWNSIFNYVMLFVFYPIVFRIKNSIKPSKENATED
jgi:ECF transporter S component (folate family)